MLESYCEDYETGQLDRENYTYVVTCGHKLKNISYNLFETKNRKFIVFPKQFVGRVVLEYEESDNIYIYKIKKIDIDCDYHDRARNVYFQNKEA